MTEWFETWTVWHWLILGFGLLIAEIAAPGVFLLWWGCAAIVTALLSLLLPTLPFSMLSDFSRFAFFSVVEISAW